MKPENHDRNGRWAEPLVLGVKWGLALLLISGSGDARSQEQSSPAPLAVVAGTILPVSGPALTPGVMTIRDGRVESVSPGSEAPAGYTVLELLDAVVIPGLVDGHTHLGLRNVPLTPTTNEFNENTQPFTPTLRVEDSIDFENPAFADALSRGTTSAVVIPGSSNLVGGSGLVLKTYGPTPAERVVPSLRILKIAFGMNPKSAYGSRSRSPKTRMAVSSMLRERFNAARRYASRRTTESDEAADPSLEPLVAALAGEMQVHIHSARADDLLSALRLVKEFGLRATIGHAYEGYLVAEDLAEAGVPVFLGPKLNGWFRGSDPERPVNVAGRLTDAGVDLSIMTDGYVDSLLLQAAFAIRLGFADDRALAAITLNPATALGIADQVGSLAPGRDADFVVLTGPPFSPGTRVRQVYVEGHLAFDHDGR